MATTVFVETFDGDDLDPAVWTTSYLPAWSSRAASAATYRVSDGELSLTIPPDQPLWCPDLHDGPLRVSAVQTGNRSGPVGSTDGQQPFLDGMLVREEQPTTIGFAPLFGRIEVECRATITARSMFSAWMVGLEDRPERCGEICLVEVFGDTRLVGCGVHPFRDARLREDFDTLDLGLDVGDWHTYAADWTPGGVVFSVDGRITRRAQVSPDYPLELMLGVFDFPEGTAAEPDAPTAELRVRRVAGASQVHSTSLSR
ncbi:glycoside hydrolase family 16 protein [Leifsonia sp. NPDC058248]|uniref:glycoside hydrolase family 16 protein n=1 Tax=Leifsonia sp. NPDC058248 TaxID=3346402 RepID=UPI0036DBC0E5